MALSTRSSPPAVTRRYRLSPGVVEITPRSSARLVAVSLSLPAMVCSSMATMRSRVVRSRSAVSGL